MVELVTLKPDFADGYFLMAMVNLRVGQIKKAIGLLEKTLSLGDSRIEYTAQLAKCYALTGQLKLAKTTALSVPLNSITLTLDADTVLGVALPQVGLHEHAIKYFECGLKLCDTENPQYSQFYYTYGECAKFLGLFEIIRKCI